MRKKVVPAIVSTIEALHNCADSNCPLLYITASLLGEHTQAVQQFAAKEGYAVGSFYAENGVFLSKNIVHEEIEIVNYPLFNF